MPNWDAIHAVQVKPAFSIWTSALVHLTLLLTLKTMKVRSYTEQNDPTGCAKTHDAFPLGITAHFPETISQE